MPGVESIEFEECDPDELFGIGWDSGDPDDPDFYEVGFGEIPFLTLVTGQRSELLKKPLVLALHAWDKAEPLDRDVEIGFWEEDENGKDITIVTSLNKFLNIRLPEILEEFDDITDMVICICNPHNAKIVRPDFVPENVKIHWPTGKAIAFKDDPQKEEINYTLEADNWTHLSN